MKRHLFLTGPIGCGKSTAIANALGDKIALCGGFLTRRCREPHLHFTLESPDGKERKTFLDFASEKPVVDLPVFSDSYLQGEVLVLDEIGGIELLEPKFADALETVLSSGIPILGVIKGAGPAGALIEKLGLTEAYKCAYDRLRKQLLGDPDTLVYECTQYDKNALLLARQWTEEYLHD